MLADDRRAYRTLIVACLALASAGLDPQLLDPGAPIIRSALRASDASVRTGDDVEPVFTELIADHTRRMDALGLTA